MSAYHSPVQRQPRHASAIKVADMSMATGFAAAARHTRFVRLLRWAIPAVVAAGIAGYMLTSRAPSGVTIDVGNAAFDEAGAVIAEPRLTAHQSEGEAYQLEARRAVQQGGNADQLRLEEVIARYATLGGGAAEFTAPVGEYNAATSLLSLSGGVTMMLGNGVEGRMEAATIDIGAGTIAADRSFELNAGNFILTGGALEMTPDGLTAGGGVQTILTPGGLTPLPRLGEGAGP